MDGSAAESPRLLGPRTRLAYAGFTLVFLVLVLYGASGPRGTDQFWYLGDTITLLDGEPPLTNTIFPGPLLRGQVSIDEPYFAHHTIVLYLVLPFAKCLGVYAGWLAFNIAAALTVATLVAITMHRLASPSAAVLAYGTFLLLPLIVWQTANVLQELALCLLTALLAVLYVFAAQSPLRWILLLVISSLAVLANPLFLAVALALPVLFLIQLRRGLKPGYVVVALLALGASLFFQAMKSHWFPSSFQPSLTAVIVSAIPGGGNMEWHHRVEPPVVTIGLLARKVFHALQSQLGLSGTAAFYWPADLMLLGSALLVLRRRSDPRIGRLLAATAGFVTLFTAMVCCHQNQFRYLAIITPTTLLCTAVFADRACTSARSRRWLACAVAAALLSFAAADAALAARARSQGRRAAAAIADIRRETGNLADDLPVIIEAESSGEPLMLAYALRPRKCLLLMQGYLPPETNAQLLDRFRPRLIFCRPGSALPELAGATRFEADWPEDYSEFEAYIVPDAGQTSRPIGK